MCGIAGKIYFNNQTVTESDLSKMGAAVRHRGPDQAGVKAGGAWGIAFQRLAIIDTSPAGNQPMTDAQESIWIVFNGEIYNFQELRVELEKDGVRFKSGTDTEAIIYLYKKYGVQCLQKLRGMFAFALYDTRKKEFFIARDRLGKKPLKYYCDKNVFIFASELKAILTQAEVAREPDFEAIDEYLTYQYVPAPKTGFKNIHKLPPAHYMIVTADGTMQIKRYWNLSYPEPPRMSETEWLARTEEKLRESVRLRLTADVPLGAHLSGGVDSSLVVALMAQELKEPVKTFSIGFKEARYNELPYARLVAERWNTNHHEFIVEPRAAEILPQLVYHYEEPYADSSALPTWYLSQMTREHVTVALNGDGGDENFAGYERYFALKLFHTLRHIPAKPLWAEIAKTLHTATGSDIFKRAERWFKTYNNNPEQFFKNIIQYFAPHEKEMIMEGPLRAARADSRADSFFENAYRSAPSPHWLNRALYADIMTYLPNDLLVKVDIASMAHALEVRSPFLDHEFMEFAAQIPANLKIKGSSKKYLLKKIAEKYLPRECVYRKKQGFSVPLGPWFNGELGERLLQKTANPRLKDYGLNPEGIRALITEHQSGRAEHGNRLWALLTLCEWLDNWFMQA